MPRPATIHAAACRCARCRPVGSCSLQQAARARIAAGGLLFIIGALIAAAMFN